MMSEGISLLENQRPEFERRRKSASISWISAYVAVASLTVTSYGSFYGMQGPMLQFLVINTNSRYDLVALSFSGGGIGVFFGCVLFSSFQKKIGLNMPLLSSGMALLVIGLVNISIPFVHSVILLVILNTISGTVYGYSISELQSVYLKKWGQVAARPFIQLHHVMYSLGNFLAPLVAKPFLEMASISKNHFNACPAHHQNNFTITQLRNGSEPDFPFGENAIPEISNPVSWPYFIIGLYGIIAAILCFILTACKVEDHLDRYSGEKTVPETRPEGKLKDLWVFFVVVIMLKFCIMANETMYNGYIFSVAVCSNLKMNVTDASLLNSLFWGGFVLGGINGVFISRHAKPSTILAVEFIGAASTMIIMSLFGEHSQTVTWIVTFVFAFAMASMFPTAMCWCSEVTNMTGKYIFVFATGGTLGRAISQPIAGVLFQGNPFSVIYFIAGLSVSSIAIYIMLIFTARRYRMKTRC